jgi:hypothetical protein
LVTTTITMTMRYAHLAPRTGFDMIGLLDAPADRGAVAATG